MHEIEIVFRPEKAARVRAMVEAAIGGPCPCATGQPCPIVGDGKARERLLAWEATTKSVPLADVS